MTDKVIHLCVTLWLWSRWGRQFSRCSACGCRFCGGVLSRHYTVRGVNIIWPTAGFHRHVPHQAWATLARDGIAVHAVPVLLRDDAWVLILVFLLGSIG